MRAAVGARSNGIRGGCLQTGGKRDTTTSHTNHAGQLLDFFFSSDKV